MRAQPTTVLAAIAVLLGIVALLALTASVVQAGAVSAPTASILVVLTIIVAGAGSRLRKSLARGD
ncbi:MAG: hypothetical protein ABI846_02675 [Rudaea sp.]